MRPIKTDLSNMIFKAPEDVEDCNDLPVRRVEFDNNTGILESCWELDEEDLEVILKTRKIYLGVLGNSHPVVCLGVSPIGSE